MVAHVRLEFRAGACTRLHGPTSDPPERGGASAELRAAILAERWRALWQYDLELIELSNPKLGKSSKKEL